MGDCSVTFIYNTTVTVIHNLATFINTKKKWSQVSLKLMGMRRCEIFENEKGLNGKKRLGNTDLYFILLYITV